jgi:hypothetical protein
MDRQMDRQKDERERKSDSLKVMERFTTEEPKLDGLIDKQEKK